MRILVTGAGGFIGSHVAEAAAARGFDVRAAILPGDDDSAVRALGLAPFVGDLSDPLVARDAVEGCEVVVNAAGRSGDFGRLPDYLRANAGTAEAVAAAAHQAGVRRFVHASSYMVSIGGSFQHWAGGLIDDSTPTTFAHWKWDFYGISKVAAERALDRIGREGGLEIVPLRIGWVYGPRDRSSFPHLVKIVRSGLGTVVGTGGNRLGLVYVTDVAEALILAATAAEPVGPHVVAGVAGEQQVTQGEYLDAVARLAGVRPPRLHVPFAAADAMARLLETCWHALGRRQRPLLTSFAVHLLGRDQVFDTTGVAASLAWRPAVTFDDGIQRTMAWLRATGSPGGS